MVFGLAASSAAKARQCCSSPPRLYFRTVPNLFSLSSPLRQYPPRNDSGNSDASLLIFNLPTIHREHYEHDAVFYWNLSVPVHSAVSSASRPPFATLLRASSLLFFFFEPDPALDELMVVRALRRNCVSPQRAAVTPLFFFLHAFPPLLKVLPNH